jgi:hypothetical protein
MQPQIPFFKHIGDVTQVYLQYDKKYNSDFIVNDIKATDPENDLGDLNQIPINAINENEHITIGLRTETTVIKWEVIKCVSIHGALFCKPAQYKLAEMFVIYNFRIFQVMGHETEILVPLRNIPEPPYPRIQIVFIYSDIPKSYTARNIKLPRAICSCRRHHLWHYSKYIHSLYHHFNCKYYNSNHESTKKELQLIDIAICDFIIELAVGTHSRSLTLLKQNCIFEPRTLRIVFDFL